ncbi:MAG: T9SS type A sorting domain-containing protein [Calditrichia bacterium]
MLKSKFGFAVVFVLLFAGLASAQVGGPYTPDANTMLLLHFDGDYTNAAQFSEDATMHGDASNFFFIPNQVTGLGQCLRIDNDSQSDSAYVTVPDTTYLDLTGDWTIEGWVNIFTFGTGSSDWRWVPRLVIKTGDQEFWQPNYFVEMWGSWRGFSCGYMAASMDQWPQANTPSNFVEVGEWYHMAFIRDTNRHILMTLIHHFNTSTNQVELVSFTVADYLSFGALDPTPITTNKPVHIGYAGGGGDSFLDGFVDEIRISNVVREFPIPPIVADVTQLGNQTTSVPQYEVGADIYTLFSSTSIQSATLYYSVNDTTNFTAIPMSTVGPDSMQGIIPQQPLGSVVRYYIEATDNNGMTFSFPRDAGWQAAEYMSFGIFEPITQTLALTFESGSGIPQDTTAYNSPVMVYGNPQFSNISAAGNYSIYLEGDSSALEVDSPFLAATEFLLDFWMYPEADMATPDKVYCRIINRPRDPTSWANNNYQVRFDPDSRLYAATDGAYTIVLDDSVEMEQWYHVQLEVRDAPAGDTTNHYAVFRLSDENDNVIEQKYVGFDADVEIGQSPLRIGKAAAVDTGSYPPFFKGYFDNIMFFNYPAAQFPLINIPSAIGDDYNNLPFSYDLGQNYPNPFNPVTEIRYSIPKSQKVQLYVYDLLGRKVKTLVDASVSSGRYSIRWNGTNDAGEFVASGIYFYQLKTKNFVETKKMMLMR